jgi:D-alanyl-D-alanine carboxypeptidase
MCYHCNGDSLQRVNRRFNRNHINRLTQFKTEWNMRSLCKLIAILSFFLIACGSANTKKRAALPPKINTENLKSVLSRYRAEYDIPALVIGIFTPDTIIMAADGIRDVISRTEVDLSDRFHIGSCTKAMTAFTAARLVEKKFLNWNTKITDVFSEWASETRAYYRHKTLADLLSHRAGIQPFFNGFEFKDVPETVFQGSNKEKREKFARWLLQRTPTVDITKPYIYSNAGYTVAAVMLERVTGNSWETLIQQEVFDPLNINGSFGYPAKTFSHQPLGHIRPSEWRLSDESNWALLPDSLHYSCELLEPAGDISISMPDYCVFLQENLKALNGRGTLLKQPTYQFLFYGRTDYAMGWGNPVERGNHYLSHDGSEGTFYCRNLLCKEKQYGLAIFANSGNNDTMNGIHKLSDVIMKTIENSEQC